MTISDICINRPVFTWVLVAIPVVLGLFSYGELGVDLFPDVDFPVCTVTTVLQGASVEEMETTVTKPIEDIINTVSGIDELRSTTTEGVSIVTVQFLLSKNGDVGMQEVRDKVNTILADLPDGTDPPIVDKFDTSSMPVMTIAVSGRRDFREVTELARKQIKERLETVNGVGSINLVGGRVRAMNVVLDTERLAGYNLSVEDVRVALVRQNLEVPGGRMDQGSRELVLRTLGRLHDRKRVQQPDRRQSQRLPDPRPRRRPRRRCVRRAAHAWRGSTATVRSAWSSRNSRASTPSRSSRMSRPASISSGPLSPPISPPKSSATSRGSSRSRSRKSSSTSCLAAALVSATILLFIRDWRTTLIATLAIPTSIIPTFMFMRYMGFTLNNITMLGLILAIGIVIDDAVVVHENIFRHMEEDGMDGMSAARQGTREIALAVLATSLSLVVIFVPIAFMGGIVGRFFSSFGLTVAFAVVMSLFVSFTLTPMLCSRFLKLEPARAGDEPSRLVEVGVLLPDDRRRVWRRAAALRYGTSSWSWSMTAVVIYSTVPIGRMMGISLIPRDDQSEYEVSVTTPEGYSLERTSQDHQRAGIADLEAAGNRTRLHDDRPDRRGPGRQGRGRRHAGHDLRPDHRSREAPRRRCRSAAGGTSPAMSADFFAGIRSTSSRSSKRFGKFLEDYPDLRVSVNDVSPFQGGGARRLSRSAWPGPTSSQLAAYGDQLIARAQERGGNRRPRHDAFAPQTRGPGRDRPRSGQRPGRAGRHHRRHLARLGRRPAGLEVSRRRRAIRRLAAGRIRRNDPPSEDLYQITFPRRPSGWSSWPAWRSSTKIAARPKSSA